MKRFLSSPSFAIAGFLFFILALFFYSYTQIDLSLTVSQASIVQTLEKSFQYVGYFMRPLSTQLYLVILLGLFFFYLLMLQQVRTGNISIKRFGLLIGGVTLLLLITYTAFSYDMFNYIFDAKIVTAYHENPYLKKALDYPQDPMLSFMRWTHRTYPYGPVWLGITVPLSYAGMQIFTVTFFLFKLLMALSYGGTVYFIYKILKKVLPSQALFGAAFFAFNPLVIIESLVSGHNDIVMLCLAMAAVYALVHKKFLLALVILMLSIGIKFATIFLLPVFLYAWYLSLRQKKISWLKLIMFMALGMSGAVLAASLRSNFQPWYLLYVLPFTALLAGQKAVRMSVILLSMIGLCNYIPYLYSGNWDPPIPTILLSLNLIGLGLSSVLFLTFVKKEKSVSEE